jgi:hypothetical protein
VVGSTGAPEALPSRSAPDTATNEPIVALGSALEARLRGRLPDRELRRAIRVMCDDAHRHGRAIEQLLPAFKRSLVRELDACGIYGEPRARCSAQLVAMCIDEFYDPEASP